ncbi:glycoside hydrolase family 3 N-terminal domain-containing protein [Nakamurella lactea]|uniref:glycoside hydrolase family 3 N-terminal domain-containing protein n=1 Tax=Nakamurella lactea TaxID=459515 RepID=UPI000406C7CA|nr:glycoside hydrolase family 3 N-terminal domain-containing protein [Nakamurella lactea]
MLPSRFQATSARSGRRVRRIRSALAVGASIAMIVGIAPNVVAAPAPPPTIGEGQSILNFDDGSIGALFAWGSEAASTPALTTVAADVPGTSAGNQALQAAVQDVPAGGWSGFSLDINSATDWSAYDGFAFQFLGTGSGKNLRYELKSGGSDAGSANLFETSVLDDSTGWRTVRIDFGALRLKGNADSNLRFDPTAAHGFAVTLSDLGSGNWQFDEFGLYQRTSVIEDFEGDVPIGSDTNPIGWFTWGNQPGNVSLGVTTQERGGNAGNHVLSGQYLIPGGGYGGISLDKAASEDWSAYGGISFYWYASQPTKPASPTAGDDIAIEIKDGGPDAEHSELWTTTFKDNWSDDGNRWKLVQIPFSQFHLRTDYQPGSGDTLDGAFSRTDAWGFAITMPPGKAASVGWAIDQFELYGTATQAISSTVTADPQVSLVNGGQSATVHLGVTTSDDTPLAKDVTVNYAPGDGTAVVGTNFDAFGGTLAFPAGTASGTTQDVTVTTKATTGADVARTVVIALTATGAEPPVSNPTVVINAHGLAYQNPKLPVSKRVSDLMSRMTQAEKIGQMTQAERLGLTSPATITELGLGSVLSGGGSVPAENTAAGWADMIDGFQRQALATRLQIPLIYGVDAVHGHNNVVGATILPHNIGLGASRDPAVVQAGAQVTATEVRATGIPWAFAPCLCVTRDERWGRSYEAFSEDPALVTQLAKPAIVGLQGTDPTHITGPDKVLATAKHWAGDGGTRYEPSLAGSGYPIDQGVTHVDSLKAFEKLFVSPYLPAIKAGVGSIMPSYSAVQVGDGPVIRMHEYTALNTDLLKNKLGFKGFLISDWEGINKLPGTDYSDKVARSVNSGLDMAMAPYDYATFITSLTGKVADGVVKQSRIDDAVKRILTEKFELGLFDAPFADRSKADSVGSDAHRAVARKAAAESQVLIKNSGNLLPLKKNAKVYLAGSNADDLGNQMGGWSISWQGASGTTTTGTTIRQGIEQVAPDATVTYSKDASAPTAGSDVGIVVVGETPYAEGVGDVGNNGHTLNLSTADRATIDTVCSAISKCAVLVVSGRPQLITDKLGEIDALVASWLPGTEGAGVADVLFGNRPFTGRLPVTWPASADQVPINVGDASYAPLFPYGWGLRTGTLHDRIAGLLPGASGPTRGALQAALAPGHWQGEAPRHPDQVIAALGRAAATARSAAGPNSLGEALTSAIRDIVQDRVLATTGTPSPGVSTLIAGADHSLASGDVVKAVAQLLLAWKLVS